MPYISQIGNFKITDDVTSYKSRFNQETRKWENHKVIKEFDKELTLVNVGDLTFDEDHPSFQKTVFWGRIDREGMYFLDTPWFRIATHDMDDKNLWRFYKRFRDDVMGTLSKMHKDHSQSVYYVPHIDDFQVVKYGSKANFHFPIWFLDIMIADGIIEKYKNMSKPNQPGTRWITDEGVQELYDIYEQRKAEEDPDSQLVKAFQDEFAKIKGKEKRESAHVGLAASRTEKRFGREIAKAQGEAEIRIMEQNNLQEDEEDLLGDLSEVLEETKDPGLERLAKSFEDKPKGKPGRKKQEAKA